jgi:hypothetical protein
MAFALTWPVSRAAVVGFAIIDIPLIVVCVVIVTRKLKRMESRLSEVSQDSRSSA